MRMREFRVTIGLQYTRNNPHPQLALVRDFDVHDTFLKVVAPTEEVARKMVTAWLGDEWAYIYEMPHEVITKWYSKPFGSLYTLSDDRRVYFIDNRGDEFFVGLIPWGDR